MLLHAACDQRFLSITIARKGIIFRSLNRLHRALARIGILLLFVKAKYHSPDFARIVRRSSITPLDAFFARGGRVSTVVWVT
jgi:hypothetical protein